MLFALLLIGGGKASATKVYATWGTPANEGKWDADTETYSWTQSYSNLATIFETPNGMLAQCTSIHLTTSGYIADCPYRVCFMKGSDVVATIAFYSEGQKDLVFSERNETKDLDLSEVTHISFGGASPSGSITVKNVYLEQLDITVSNPHETPLTSAMFHGWTTSGADAEIETENVWGACILNESAATPYGDSNVYYLNFADLSDYDKLIISVTDGTPRILFNRLVNNGSLGVQIPNTAEDVEKYQTVNDGVYTIDVAKIVADQGFAHLHCIKGFNGNVTISKLVAYKEDVDSDCDYIISGSGAITPEVEEVLANASITLIDATGLTSTNVELVSANPNCIFIANEGALANTENVLIDGTIANLSLTDGFPVAVPTGATADAATYTRAEMNTFGTICLPYAATAGEGEKFYTIDKIEGDLLELNEVEGELAAGTPAIVEKLGGEGITISGSGALASVAEVEGSLKLVGTLVEKTILASESQLPIYAISENKFVKATETITLPAFRAYFTAEDIAADDAPAKLRLGIAADDATAIGAVAGEGNATVVGIYSVNGAEQKSLQKGVNIIKMSDGTVQKVLVK